jgi:hypothetical protein
MKKKSHVKELITAQLVNKFRGLLQNPKVYKRYFICLGRVKNSVKIHGLLGRFNILF